jgi:hypothetical protein
MHDFDTDDICRVDLYLVQPSLALHLALLLLLLLELGSHSEEILLSRTVMEPSAYKS